MNLSPQERDKLLIYLAAQVAKDRKQRGLKLNVPEATALITAALMEMAREGKSVSEIIERRPRDPYPRRCDARRARIDHDDPGRADLP